jgi:hypothetical protein
VLFIVSSCVAGLHGLSWWTDSIRLVPLLQVKLDLGCVRLARDPANTLMEPLAALTALSDLRMRVYSNGETPLTLHLSQLNSLTNLQVGLWRVMGSPWSKVKLVLITAVHSHQCCACGYGDQHTACVGLDS